MGWKESALVLYINEEVMMKSHNEAYIPPTQTSNCGNPGSFPCATDTTSRIGFSTRFSLTLPLLLPFIVVILTFSTYNNRLLCANVTDERVLEPLKDVFIQWSSTTTYRVKLSLPHPKECRPRVTNVKKTTNQHKRAL